MKKLFVLLLALLISLLCLFSCDLNALVGGGAGGENNNEECLHENTTVTKAAVAPTCVSAGRTEEISCSDCQTVVTASSVLPIDEDSHGELVEIPEVPSSCSVIGSTAGSKCSLCDTTVVFPQTMPKTAHTWIIEESKPVSCTEDGYIGGVICTECGYTPTANMINSNPSLYPEGARVAEVLPMYGHYEGAGDHITLLEAAVAPSCIAYGSTAELYCAKCESTIEKEVIPKTPHNYDSNDTCKTTGCSAVAEYPGKYISFLGDSITSYADWSNNPAYNSTLSSNAYYYSSAKLAVTDTWWHQAMTELKLNFCVNNSVDAGRVTDTKEGVSSGIDRALNLYNDKNNQKPDIIVIYLGTNDLAAGILEFDFELGYNKLLSNIKTAYPEAKVFCCTILPESRTPSTNALVSYNNIIKECAESKGYEVIDLYSELSSWSYTKYTFVDNNLRVHPKAEGMDLMSECVVKAIKEFYGRQD